MRTLALEQRSDAPGAPLRVQERVAAWVAAAVWFGLAIGLALPRVLDPGPGDIDVYRAGGAAVRGGVSLYSDQFHSLLTIADGFNFTYPPFAAVLFVPLSVLPLWAAYALWTVATLAVLAWLTIDVTRPLVERVPDGLRGPARLALAVTAASLAPLQDHLPLGQIGVFLVAACWWDVTRTGHRGRGVLVGLCAAVKIVPALIIGYLLVTRQWRAAATATGTWAVAWGAAWLALPDDTHRYLVDHVATEASRLGHIEAPTNQSWNGLLVRSGMESSSVLWWALALATLVLGTVAAVRLRRATGRDHEALVVLALAGVMATPVAWVHHAVWIVPALGLLLQDGRDVVRRRLVIGLTVLYAIPSDVFFMRGTRVLVEAYLAGYVVLAVALTLLTLRRRPA